MDKAFLEACEHYKQFLEYFGIFCNTPDTIDTPTRVGLMYKELFSSEGQTLKPIKGLVKDVTSEIKLMQFDNHQYDQLIVVKDIPFSSMCSHHHVPFIGTGHIGYLPGQSLIGLSKTARVLEFFSKKPQTQEKLTEETCSFLFSNISPRFVMVVLEAEHLCMTIRGIKKPGSKTTTSKLMWRQQKEDLQDKHSLSFEQVRSLKEEFFRIIYGRHYA